MNEPDLPILLTFDSTTTAFTFVNALETAKEKVIWEQRITEYGNVIVTILNIINLEERQEQEDIE